jgi:threonine dehydratase
VQPHNTPMVKQNAVRGYGAQIVHCSTRPTDRAVVAAEWVERSGGVFIHPSDDPDVMSGQGTAALELLEQVEHDYGVQLDAVLAPVGGGGLSAGTAMAVKVRKADRCS